ncbi:hypothetical protein ES703_30205 [subsurface metagenome]
MSEIVMNDDEKQVFGLICSNSVSRNELLELLKEREGCSRATLDRILKKFKNTWEIIGKGSQRAKLILTEKGREEEKSRKTKPTVTFDNPGLAKVISKLPTRAHRGLVEFILSVIVAKKYLAEKLGDKGIWGNFIISGRPKDIKTLLGEIVCRTLELPFETHIQRCLGKSEAQVLGEATLIEDGLRKLRLPPYLLYPFIVWDDLDKASTRGAWDALLVYLDGRYKFEERYTPITKQVTTLATMNPKKKGGFDIPDYYLRRAFTVNSANLPCDQKENEIIGTDISDNPIPKLKVEGLTVVEDRLDKDEKDFIRDLLYDRWITDEAKGIVDANLLHAVVLGILILKKSVDVRYYSFWAVETYLCFLDTLGYTKGAWREELTQEWSNYVLGSNDDKLKEEWEEQAKQIKEEKDRIDEGKKKIKVVVIDKDARERVLLSKYTPKIDRLKEVKNSFEEMDGDKQHTVLLCLSMDLRKFRLYLPTEKRANRVTEDVLRELEIVLTEWEEQYKPIREAWEKEKKQERERKEYREAILRQLTDWKASLKKWRYKDKNGVLWTERVKPAIAKIGNVLNPKTQKKFYNKTYLYEIKSDIVALIAEVRIQEEEAETKKAGLVEMPQVLSGVFDDLTREESMEVIEEAVESVGAGEPFKTTRTVPYYEYLLIKLDRWLKGKGKKQPPTKPKTIGFMGRTEEDL